MKNKYIYIVSLFLLPISAYSQYSISGEIKDKSERSVQNASVLLYTGDSLVSATISDDKGKFKLKDVPSSNYYIQYLSLGYKSKKKHLIYQVIYIRQ